ncbi:hypothetical protein M8C21_015980 [Ambrosia artemisiifolia]|uniref:Cell cycle checkpoint control protein RAD9A n=1 Tax=Ambrosia artemisiifolia TaxID=4212 RepID=A0AAD5CFV6_AMBAR|nr:hypothetical protein M8C21_015980 [Ambrosia artemisiifolia]
MEWSVSGNALKTLGRCVTCLARIGNDLTLQASSSQAICAVLRTPLTSIDHLSVILPDPDASKVQWTLDCFNGMKKSYWITCNVEANVQQLSLDRRRLPSSFVVRPRDLNRLLSNFQSSLQEITVIATEPTSDDEVGGKAVELRSYIDPAKENDSSLHTQLWIDPSEEFVQYKHTGDPVDVTFGVKELKAFLSFCEGCEVDIHLYFEKAGEPILMAPKFIEDASVSNFDATLVLATMLVSQLHGTTTTSEPVPAAAAAATAPPKDNVSEHPSDHTRIWSELSASATKSANPSARVHVERDLNTNDQGDIQRIRTMHISKDGPDGRNFNTNACHPIPMETEHEHVDEASDRRAEINDHAVVSQHHLSNWVDDDDNDEEDDDSEPYVQATPPYCD